MAILDLQQQTEIYWNNWCAAQGPYCGLKWGPYMYDSKGQNPVRVYDHTIYPVSNIVTNNPINSAVGTLPADNYTSVPQQATLTFNEATTESKSTTTEHGITAGASVTVKSEAGFLFAKVGVEATISFEYNYSNSNTTTTEKTRGWSATANITVPPHSRVVGSLIVQTGPFDIDIVLESLITGTTSIYYGTWWDYSPHYWATANISDALTANGVPNVQNLGNGVARFKGLGKLKGGLGLQAFVKFVESPLPGYAGQTREYQMPVSLKSELGLPIFDPIIALQ